LKRQFTLKKYERLKSRKLTEQLFKNGHSFVEVPFRVFYLPVNNEPQKVTGLLFGCGVSKRNFKKAVDRNRIKRLIREAYRLQKNELQELMAGKQTCLSLFILYTGKELPDFNLAKEKVSVILMKLISTFSVEEKLKL
jgi:ribonuclease P protein component